MVLFAPAKVNLYLRILNKRPDGYHNIETVFERIALFDKIVLRSLNENKINIFCDNPKVPRDKTGLMHRAVSLVQKEEGISKGAEVKIFKRIPVAAGLGGGSSDAASVLTGLNKLWKLSLSPSRLSELGGKLGADIPFFLSGNSFAMGEEKGNEIMPFPWKGTKFWHLLISPPVSVLSKDVYGMYKKDAFPASSKKGFIRNDLEPVVFKKEPLVHRLKTALENIGLKLSLVSGSGPSVFSLFEKRKEAMEAKELLIRRFPFVKGKGWQIFVVSTL